MGSIRIDMLGTSFTLQSSEDTQYLEKIVAYYSKTLEEVSNIPSVQTPLQQSILTGIMLIDELYKEKNKVISLQQGQETNISTNSIDDNEINNKTIEMIQKIGKVL